MKLGTYAAIYFLVWWVVLFAVLPWGVRNQEEAGDIVPGSDPGAPAMHRLWGKLGWTTVYATVIFAALYFAYDRGFIPIEFLARISTPPH